MFRMQIGPVGGHPIIPAKLPTRKIRSNRSSQTDNPREQPNFSYPSERFAIQNPKSNSKMSSRPSGHNRHQLLKRPHRHFVQIVDQLIPLRDASSMLKIHPCPPTPRAVISFRSRRCSRFDFLSFFSESAALSALRPSLAYPPSSFLRPPLPARLPKFARNWLRFPRCQVPNQAQNLP